MKRIDFEHFGMYEGISHGRRVTGDARETFADILYTRTNGIRAHALALKIYRSKGMEEYDEQEAALILKAAGDHCTPAFIDGLLEQMKGGGDESDI